MDKVWSWHVVACGLFLACTVFPSGEARAAGEDGTAAVKTAAHRQSESDLEISGELTGFPAGSVRYISREELLKLPQVSNAVDDDANFTGTVEISGVLLRELMRALSVAPAGKIVVAICVDQYHAHYPEEYVQAHQPVLVLKINGLPPASWPTNAEVHGAAMGPFLISHAKFTPRFKILAHEDEPQVPWGVVRLEFRKEATVLAAIAPRGTHRDEAGVKSGYVIAQQNCFRCHDSNGEGGKKSGRPWPVLAAWAEASPARFAAYVRNPQGVNAKSQMAPSPQYDDATMQALIEYFKTFLPEGKR
jgi:mono/diheme cytochrome c family protein